MFTKLKQNKALNFERAHLIKGRRTDEMFYVYSCGSNGRYQLGNGTDEDLNQLERVFETTFRPVKVVCGGNHTLILLENGDLFSAGDNTHGQCGIVLESDSEGDNVVRFTQVPRIGGVPWVDCSAGYEFSVFVNESQEVYSSGFGLKGELGQGEKASKSTILKKIDHSFNSETKKIKSCLDHTVILLENGQVFGWGNGRSGKLGQPAISKLWTPRQIETGFEVMNIEIGRDFTVLGGLDQNIEILGKDKFSITSQIPNEWIDFKAMWSSVHFIKSNGQILSIGNDSHGQLTKLGDYVKYDLFEVGSEHTILQIGQSIKSWGWGEHGNCGINKTDSVTFDYINEIHKFPLNESIIGINGGCATTWVITQSNE
ncbi:putative E3 ubiquitin-protein ligase [Wickerhamomyces ciferrii]|uniref:E3 ubiquitin-protein ligase n=1 Tax=Wickerhamomyces ciferrii (strain ATCC 14091 / BCRC 22168 / CBS 111 / JCM 3599 / NBRC 0793 / NRRL Y-1031 F-60-10) TaxID=1206466 RepID=K0KH75_WICCF|nr:putative E3 ubiquitin-protein ligase [Wickerhamomyces ciferrii]CCH40523.1 putative E3 ubiquitin-protein ligase [Wickerhamomyces ciferrii]